MTPHRQPGLLQLPQAVLENILSMVAFKDRVRVLPLVCRELNEFLKRGSSLWSEVLLSCDFTDPQDLPNFPVLTRWLAQRAGSVQRLELMLLVGLDVAPAEVAPLWPHLNAALTALAPGLEFLKLAWSGRMVVGDWATRATRLDTAALMADGLVFEVPLSGMTALRTLELSTLQSDGLLAPPEWLPSQLERLTLIPAPGNKIPEQVLCGLPRLSHLDVSESIFGPEALRDALPQLGPRLTSLALDETDTDLPPQLSLLTNLRVLSLDKCRFVAHGLHSIACPLTVLRRLASLSLSNISLQLFPSALLRMTSLENLYLENNSFIRLGKGPYLGMLRVLSIDWDCLFGSLQELCQATGLRELALGRPPSMSLREELAVDNLQRASAETVLGALGAHPSLEVVVVLAGYVGNQDAPTLEVLLRLAGCRPGGLAVRALNRTEYFVADPQEADTGSS